MQYFKNLTLFVLFSILLLPCFGQRPFTPVSYDLIGISDFSKAMYIGERQAAVISDGSVYHLRFDEDFDFSIDYIENSGLSQDQLFRMDVDRDGIYDLLSIDTNKSPFFTYLNTPAGFDDVSSFFGGTGSSFAEQDFDGDGELDLIINGRVYSYSEGGALDRIMNRQPSNDYVFESPHVMDINGDGLQDVIVQLVTNLGYLRNNGEGTLILDLFSELNHQCRWMRVINTVDGPRVIYYDYDNTIYRLSFEGGVITKTPLVADQPNYGFETLVTDLNADGNEELIIYAKGVNRYYLLAYDNVNETATYESVSIEGGEGVIYIDDLERPMLAGLNGNAVTVYESDSNLNLSVRKRSIATTFVYDRSFVDMDGDGFVDVWSGEYLRGYYGASNFGLLESFTVPGTGGVFIDFDGDLDADYVTAEHWYENVGDNQFGPIQDNPNYVPYPDPDVFFTTVIYEGDMDEDGDVDLLTYNVFGEPLELLENIDNEYFADPVRLADSDLISGDLLKIEVSDINGDDQQDILMATASGLVYWQNEGGVSFAPGVVLFEGVRRPRGIDVQDADGDGLPEVVMGTGMISAGATGGAVYLYRGTSSGPQLVGTFDDGPGYKRPAFIDYDNNGADDILVSDGSTLEIYSYFNYDSLSDEVEAVDVDFDRFGSFLVMDVDGDNDDDIIVYDDGGIALQYLLKDESISASLCPLNNIRLQTQEQLDLYARRFGGCRVIAGDVYLGGLTDWSDIEHVDALSNIEQIEGSLSARFMNGSTDLDGLRSIDSIGGRLTLEILRLGSQSILPQVRDIGKNLIIRNVLGLTTGGVFGNLQSIGGGIAIELSDLDRLDHVLVDSVVHGDFRVVDTYDELMDAGALSILDSIYGSFYLHGSAFEDLSVLEGLRYATELDISAPNVQTLKLGISQDTIVGDCNIRISATGGTIAHDMQIKHISGGLSLLAQDIGDWSHLRYVHDYVNVSTEKLQAADFGQLQSVGQMNVRLYQPHDYSNFSALREVRESFIVSPSAFSFDGLDMLDSINGNMSMIYVPHLTSLASLRDEVRVGGEWRMHSNPNLNFCESSALCHHLESGRGYVIYDNAAGCDDISDISCLNNSVSGVVFYDYDEDGQYDEGVEARMKDVRLIFDDNQEVVVTGSNGFYRRHLLPGQSFKVETAGVEGLEFTTPTFYEIDSFIPDQSGLVRRDFGLLSTTAQRAYETSITSSIFVCNRAFDVDLLLGNRGSNVGSGEVRLRYHPSLILDPVFSDFLSHDEDNHILTLGYDQLYPFFDQRYVIPFIAPSADLLDNSDIGISVTVVEIENGKEAFMHDDYLPLSLLCSYDPNDKLVSSTDKTGNIRVNHIDDELIYTIRFQNTGNFYAENVRITDQISETLDLSTFRFLDASHEVDITIRGSEITFMFEDIFLIDSTTNFVESQGFVSFAIQPFVFDLDEEFTNQASIYFDLNEPIITNVAESKVYDPTVSTGDHQMEYGRIFPLPADDFITIQPHRVPTGKLRFCISDMNGRIIDRGPMEIDDLRLHTGHIRSGVYGLTLTDALGVVSTFKLVIMH